MAVIPQMTWKKVSVVHDLLTLQRNGNMQRCGRGAGDGSHKDFSDLSIIAPMKAPHHALAAFLSGPSVKPASSFYENADTTGRCHEWAAAG
eukprot:2031687-Amphidinium_carterae.2